MARNTQDVTSISPTTIGANLGTTPSSILFNGSTNSFTKINSIIVSNVDGTNDVDVTVYAYINGNPYHLAKTVTVPADSTLIVLTKDTPIVLQEDWSIDAYASASSDAQIIIQYDVCS
jgi:hypothetical protein